MVILAIKTALENMDKKYCKLSQIDYSMLGVNEPTEKYLVKEKGQVSTFDITFFFNKSFGSLFLAKRRIFKTYVEYLIYNT